MRYNEADFPWMHPGRGARPHTIRAPESERTDNVSTIRPDRGPANDQCVVIGLSGGVDSAVAAALLVEQGYAVQGVVLETWHPEQDSTDPVVSAEAVATHLGIPLVRSDARGAFYARVVEPFLDTYARGHTPNPCVLCNPALKIATLLDEADRIGASWIATGHYARVLHSAGKPSRLLQARAGTKDQSYALYRLTQRHLNRLLLPLGDVESKAQVRALARTHGLPVAEADDSQDLCFVAGSGYTELLAALRPDALRPGPILDAAGRYLGDHQGLSRYTIGQRSGLGIAAPAPLYVLGLDPERNALIVGPRDKLESDACWLSDVTFTGGRPPSLSFSAEGRIRYRAPLTPITIKLLASGEAHVSFAEPQVGIAPGQSLVFYAGEETLGGGIICSQSDTRHQLEPLP